MIGVYVSTFSKYDATCNDAVSMCEILLKSGYRAKLIAAHFMDPCELVPWFEFSDGMDAMDDNGSLLIYHYGSFDPNFEKVLSLKCKKVFRFHNITEPKFFNGYDPVVEDWCAMGIEQTRYSLGGFDGYWSNSPFTAGQLVRAGGLLPEDSDVLYPFHRIERRLNGGRKVPRIREDKREIKLLNVGRICPHKNQRHLLQCFRELQAESDRTYKLTFVGKIGPAKYWEEIMEELAVSGMGEHVTFLTDGISERELEKQYREADIFCCVSRHEGYCVPVLEAMSFSIPVVSTPDTALRDTIGSFGLLVENDRILQLKHAIMRLAKETKFYHTLSKLSYLGYRRRASPGLERVFSRKISTVIETQVQPQDK